jgi:hypothetical protein
MNPETLSKLSDLGLHYGPFFFALLFLAIIPRWPYRIFKETNAKKNPPATPAELTSARVVFLVTFFFGLGLVVVSVAWWLRSQPKIYAFQGEIVDLHEYEALASASDKLYFREETRPLIDDIPLRNEHFVVVQGTPLAKGQNFDVEFSKNKSTRNTFHIPYTPGDDDARYRVNWDDNLHTNVLQRDTSVVAESRGFVWTAHAAQAGIPVYQGRSPKSQMAQMQASSPVAVLQDSNSDVGSKIVALDQLERMPVSVLTDRGTGSEPVLATLLDLTRYSDKEVSYKAELLIKKVNLDEYLVRKLSSPQAKDQHEGQQVLLKMDKADSERILAKLKPAKASQLRGAVSQAANFQVIPTPSAQGDRYYVKATWDPNNAKTVDCLTTLFHAELINNRSSEQERTLMNNRSQRLVYWYDKEWTISMASKIRACGGNAVFVQAGVAK